MLAESTRSLDYRVPGFDMEIILRGRPESELIAILLFIWYLLARAAYALPFFSLFFSLRFKKIKKIERIKLV